VRLPPDTIFTIVKAGSVLATVGLALFLFTRSRPMKRWFRGLLAVAAAWITGIAYTIYVYNPAGTEAARYAGMHFPENHFDNNTIAVALLGGWIAPAIAVGIVCGLLTIRDRVALRTDERTPNKSLERTREG
jgi:Mn2+/Fe2+ NRAMP family transporter